LKQREKGEILFVVKRLAEAAAEAVQHNTQRIIYPSHRGCSLEADRISFSFYFSAPENAFFYFSAFYFSAEKDIRIFVPFPFFGTNMAVKKNKKKEVSTSAEPMHGGQNSESPAVAYSRCLHRHPQCMSTVRQ